MLYPIYDYYIESSMNLEDILSHYVEHFYLRKYGRDKYEKILKKISESDKIRKLFDQSYYQRLAINHIDFGETLNSIMWFMFQSNDTQAVAVLAMAVFWDTNVNSHLHLKSDMELRNDALKIFKKFSIYGDMTQEEFDSMRRPQVLPEEDYDEVDSEKGNGYHILNFYLDCTHWHRQENEIKKCPLKVPIKIIDVNKEDDVVFKYVVHNLPTLILVDGKGKEIHRWVGVTTASEINDYLTANGYAENEDEEDDEDYPQPLNIPFSYNDELKLKSSEYADKVLAIMADGGTKDQIKVKLEVLLNKRKPTESMKKVEGIIRNFYRRSFDAVGKLIIEESNGNAFLQKLIATTKLAKFNSDIDDIDDIELNPTVKQMQETANNFCVSWNIIKDEEYKRALAIYRDGKVVD